MGMLERCPKCKWRIDASRVTCPNCGITLPTLEESRAREAEEQARQIAPDLTDEQRQRIVEEERLRRQEERLRQHLRERPEASGSAARGQMRGGEIGSEKARKIGTTTKRVIHMIGLCVFIVVIFGAQARGVGAIGALVDGLISASVWVLVLWGICAVGAQIRQRIKAPPRSG